jgi:hypothetical protein
MTKSFFDGYLVHRSADGPIASHPPRGNSTGVPVGSEQEKHHVLSKAVLGLGPVKRLKKPKTIAVRKSFDHGDNSPG